MFWPPKRDEFKGRLLNKVIQILRPQIIQSNPQYFNEEDGLMPIEISIQKFTEVDILSPWIPEEDKFERVEMKNSAEFIGQRISVRGYLKTPFQSLIQGNSSYGCGAITDLTFRLPVNVTSLDGVSSPCKGAYVEINGLMRMNNFHTIILQAESMNDVKQVNDEVKTTIDMRKGDFALVPKENQVPDTRRKPPEDEQQSAELKRKKRIPPLMSTKRRTI